jgi:hypothetical protein
MLDVMHDANMRQEQVRARDGRRRSLAVTPYRTLENKLDGAVVSRLDIGGHVPLADGEAGALSERNSPIRRHAGPDDVGCFAIFPVQPPRAKSSPTH